MRLLDAWHILQGLDPAVSRGKVYAHDTLAIKGHRGADLLSRDRLYMRRKFHHPGDPTLKKKKGEAGYDNLGQVCPCPCPCPCPKIVLVWFCSTHEC